jgi:hypothetical protein
MCRLKTRITGQRKSWEESGGCDANLGIRGGDAAFGGANIGSPLEQPRRHVGRHHRRFSRERRGGERQIGWRFTDEYSDRMLELCALQPNIDGLCLRRRQLCVGLIHVGPRNDPRVVLIARQCCRTLVGIDRFIE